MTAVICSIHLLWRTLWNAAFSWGSFFAGGYWKLVREASVPTQDWEKQEMTQTCVVFFPVCVVYLAACALKLLLLLAFILGQQLHLSNNASSRNKTVRILTALSRVARRYTTPPCEPLQVFSHCRTEKAPRQQDQEFFTAFPLGLSPPRLLKSAAVF